MKITTKGDASSSSVEINFEAKSNRRCGECTLCCRLLPNVEFDKPAGVRCQHQRHGKGCRIYPTRPLECQFWSCRWLAAETETAGMKRPDRAHYVIDAMPDEIHFVPHGGGKTEVYQALQIWVDPAFPQAAHDPELRAYMARMAEDFGYPSLLRWNNREATAVFPPALNADRQWHEQRSGVNPNIGIFSELPKAWRERLR